MVTTLHRAAVCFIFLAAAAYSPGPQADSTRFEFLEAHMGTRFKLVLYAQDAETAAASARAAFARVAQLDATMSDYRESSELVSLCRRAGRGPVKVSEDLFRVLAGAQEWARRTDGAFDVTVGPLVQLWRRARRTGELPDARRLAQARKLTGYRKLHLDEQARSVRLDRSGMRLDLGGIAKGFAADEAIAVLKRRGISSALVAAGGDIAVSDPPPGTAGWLIAIASPGPSDRPSTQHLSLRAAAVSSSGDAEQYLEIGGVRYSHVVDPRTGLGVVGRRSVTVVAPDGTTSDALATASSVLGTGRGLKLIDSTEGAAALFIQATGQGLQSFESKRWHAVPKGEPRAAK